MCRRIAIVGLILALLTGHICMTVLALHEISIPTALPTLLLTTLGALCWVVHYDWLRDRERRITHRERQAAEQAEAGGPRDRPR